MPAPHWSFGRIAGAVRTPPVSRVYRRRSGAETSAIVCHSGPGMQSTQELLVQLLPSSTAFCDVA